MKPKARPNPLDMSSILHVLKIGLGASCAVIAILGGAIAFTYACWRLSAILGRPIGRLWFSLLFPHLETESERRAREAMSAAESKQRLQFLIGERSFNEKLVAFLFPLLLGTWCMLFEFFVLGNEARGRDGWDEMGLWSEKGIAYAGAVASGVAEGFIAQAVFALLARAVEERRARGSWAAVVGVFGRS